MISGRGQGAIRQTGEGKDKLWTGGQPYRHRDAQGVKPRHRGVQGVKPLPNSDISDNILSHI